MQFTDINKTPIANKQFKLSVYSGTKNLSKGQVVTDDHGLINASFSAPQKPNNLFLVAEAKDDGKKTTIPLQLNRPENIDLQFLPEGGDLVAGLPAHIGFKAIGENGKAVEVSGVITDQGQKQVAVFQSVHKGIGSFDMVIQAGEVYTAKITLPDGKIREYPLPIVKASGTSLQVKNPLTTDSVEVIVSATEDIAKSGTNYFLIGKARGLICYAAIVNFSNNNSIRKKIAKALFPSGIARFILTSTKGQPLNERLVFIDHADNLQIEMVDSKAVHLPKDSVALQLSVTDKTGKPIAGNFSMTVTDDAQVAQDSLNNDNIIVRLLLTADLKGQIEAPGYYLQNQNANSWQALDNLLLTQGWVSYDWPAGNDKPLFKPETEFTVKGQVVNTFRSPVKGTRVQLLSKSPLLASDTLTNKNGEFVFNNFPRIDTPAFQLSALNKHGKSFNVDIKMDEDIAPLFKPVFAASMPWYINSDAAMLNYTKAKDSVTHLQDNFIGNGHHLKEVKIIAQKIVKGSQNLNGPGNADLVLDEKDMIKEGKKNWLDILNEKVKGFRESTFIGRLKRDITFFYFLKDAPGASPPYPYQYDKLPNSFSIPWYFIDDKPVKFIIDGVSLGKLIYKISLEDVITYLKSHNAEDIKGVEVLNSSKYTGKYIPADFGTVIGPAEVTFIEITTRMGTGAWTAHAPGTYLYKPLPLSQPIHFYKPRYTVNDTAKREPDFRSTIDWEPNVITDKNGNAAVSFFAADKPGTYTYIIEGTDGNGNLGYKMGKIVIGRATIKSPKPKSDSK